MVLSSGVLPSRLHDGLVTLTIAREGSRRRRYHISRSKSSNRLILQCTVQLAEISACQCWVHRRDTLPAKPGKSTQSVICLTISRLGEGYVLVLESFLARSVCQRSQLSLLQQQGETLCELAVTYLTRVERTWQRNCTWIWSACSIPRGGGAPSYKTSRQEVGQPVTNDHPPDCSMWEPLPKKSSWWSGKQCKWKGPVAARVSEDRPSRGIPEQLTTHT